MATELSSTKVAGGTLRRVKHASAATATDMVFAIFTQGVESTNEAIHILESGECLRCVVIY